MGTLEALSEFKDKKLDNFPEIVYSNLYKKVMASFHFEFQLDEGTYLFSPYHTLLIGEDHPELLEFVSNNDAFLDSLKKFLLTSLFVYSALIEENSYYLSNPQSIMIARLIHKREARFEVKFYTHYDDELLTNYKDKIYIGRDFINLKKFERKYLGLKKYFLSLIEQNDKIQDRAKQKLRYFNDYKEPYLDEINYLVREAVSDAMDRIKFFKETKLADIPNANLLEVLDSILYMLNLMIELRDLTQEFDNKLRIREENDFVKYLTKFLKDLIDGIRYMRKLSCMMHLRISKYAICTS
ncbi:MAG: hypothetical protein GTO45_31870 [Candidatus Aminicenantes bacterium]|nr:hypothetical protein [Candidatus Aminicenantes bacterium]NIM83371.1 hypothetical protein [Candidatus Aminicenantes bacterium]NIN22735.1 hypothetical protein [Candidatus Aminicenantes bacterium]NIN46495.1 hypothetical protein [Candidatus Aminicenantes bacterium]NIN89377.1 hypothetical protein [Candidatus Aminicenantes bacterium]